ncbi:MAG: helix-turn-helix domain-containing protein [Natrialbaceae archaeon]|nr:helix-turn-helix domain-containing protein [Natrialbaceae archaeon]
MDREAFYLFFEVGPGDFDAFDRAVSSDPTVQNSTEIIGGDSVRVYRMEVTSDWLVFPQAAGLGLHILRAISGDAGWITTLEVPDMEALQEFRRHCECNDVHFRIRQLIPGVSESGSGYGLTDTQRETLLVAYDHGYFEDPRSVTVADLATALDISPSATSTRLRRSMETLVENTIARRPT